MMPVARANQFRGADRQISFVQDRATWIDLTQGPVETTGNPLDVAISGNAFLTVQTPRGERYTRNGALQINNQGQLVTSEGLQVVGQNGPIVFQPTDREISIGIDGLISVREGQNTIDAQRGKLKLASFAQPQQLQKDGTSTYMAPAGVTPQVPTDAKVTQGAVEKSNVQSVMAMTRMVEISRSYTQIAQILQNQSDMRRSAIEKLAEVPA
jgi:flagellar basal body rod protein FlgG